jgi:hypothetical protein
VDDVTAAARRVGDIFSELRIDLEFCGSTWSFGDYWGHGWLAVGRWAGSLVVRPAASVKLGMPS